jgi:hypothetical protein
MITETQKKVLQDIQSIRDNPKLSRWYERKYWDELKKESNKLRESVGLEPLYTFTYDRNVYKQQRIQKWRFRNIKCDDFDSFYDVYVTVNKCDSCGSKIVGGREGTYKCLDHNHKTGEIRGIVCVGCNTRRGREDKLKEMMFNRLKFAVRISKSH